MAIDMKAAKIIVYGDLISQPTRAVLCFLKMNQIPHEFKELRVFKGEHKTEEFKKLNPFQKVPTITDTENGLNLFESHAILKYLQASREKADHWYPKSDIKKRAKIDEYLDWHHGGLRSSSITYLI